MKRETIYQSFIINHSNASIEEELDVSFKKTETHEVTISSSILKSHKDFDLVEIQSHAGLNWEIIDFGVEYTSSWGFEDTIEQTEAESNTVTNSEERTYELKKTIQIGPNQSVHVLAFTHWIDNVVLPFKAKFHITGFGPKFLQDRRLHSDVLKVFIDKFGLSHEKLINQTSKSLIFEGRGQVKASFGLSSIFNIKQLDPKQNMPFSELFTHLKQQKNGLQMDKTISYVIQAEESKQKQQKQHQQVDNHLEYHSIKQEDALQQKVDQANGPEDTSKKTLPKNGLNRFKKQNIQS